MTKHIRSILLSSAFVLSFSGLSGIAATYAWFTVKDIARVNQISLSISDSANLSIGYRKNHSIVYKQELSEEDFEAIDPNYMENINLRDVSGMHKKDWLEAKPFIENRPVLLESYSRSSFTAKTEQATSGYLQFELYFRCEYSGHLYLSEKTAASKKWKSVDEDKHRSSREEVSILDVVRASFYTEEHYYIAHLSDAEKTTQFAGPLNIRGDDEYFDSEDGKEIVYGSYQGTPAYFPAADEDTGLSVPLDCFSAKHQAGIMSIDTKSIHPEVEESHPISQFIYDGSGKGGSKYNLGYVPSDTDYRMVFTVYLEGWDRSMNDTIRGERFRLNISFVLLMDE